MTASPEPLAHALLAQARAGDPAALEALLRHCQPDLRRYARRHCHTDDVDEAVQDALWILSRRLTALRAVAALSSWLFQVVKRSCLRLRARSFPPQQQALDDEQPELMHDERATHDLQLDLAQVLAGLPQHYREMLVLIDLLGHSAEEAAAQLNLSIEATKSRLHRARMMVRERWPETGDLANGSRCEPAAASAGARSAATSKRSSTA
jgi:RNA polymerase sigma factor (sigma-70 family)